MCCLMADEVDAGWQASETRNSECIYLLGSSEQMRGGDAAFHNRLYAIHAHIHIYLFISIH